MGEAGVQANPMLSPDGDRVVVDITDLKSNNLDIWIEDIKKETRTRFTFDPAEETDGIWSRDGSTIAFRSNVGGSSVNLKKTLGLEPEKILTAVKRQTNFLGLGYIIPNSWSRDDKQILGALQTNVSGSKLVLMNVPSGEAKLFLNSGAIESNGVISDDGQWVAYASNESSDWEIYVTTFPGAAGKWQVSLGGGSEPRWRGDGKAIYYLGPTGTLMTVPVETGATFSSGTPTPLFQIRGRAPISSTDLFTYDVTKDGQRFLVNQYMKPDHIPPLTIVQHVMAEAPK